MTPSLSRLFLSLAIATTASAQSFGYGWYPHPANWSQNQLNCTTNCPQTFPLTPGPTFAQPGWAKAQLLVPVADLPQVPTILQELAWKPLLLDGAFGVYHYQRIVVTLAQTPAAQLSTTFASNLTVNPQIVMDRSDHYWTPNGAPSFGPASPAGIGMEVPYAFDPALGNLVIDLEVYGARQIIGTGFYGFLRGNVQTVAAYGWGSTGVPPASGTPQTAGLVVWVVTSKALLDEFGKPCPTSTGSMPFVFDPTFQQPVLGSTQRIDLVDGTPNAPAFFFGGTSLVYADLAAIGAPSCMLYPVPEAAQLVSLDANGNESLNFTLPNASALLGARAWFQFAILDPGANSLGIATSSYVRLLLGTN